VDQIFVTKNVFGLIAAKLIYYSCAKKFFAKLDFVAIKFCYLLRVNFLIVNGKFL
jgi:hypothetical protein